MSTRSVTIREHNSTDRLLGSLLSLLLSIVVNEVTEEVRVLGLGDNTDIVAKGRLLEELLGKVLDVTLGHRDTAGNGKSRLILGDKDISADKAGLGILGDLDAGNEVRLESIHVEEGILNGLRAVDGVTNNLLGLLALGGNTL